ncbi:MAG: tetratricopeptide repeat protein [Armatimonadota bacterium]
MPDNRFPSSVYRELKSSPFTTILIIILLALPAIAFLSVYATGNMRFITIAAVIGTVIILAAFFYLNKPAEYTLDSDKFTIHAILPRHAEIRFSDVYAIRTTANSQAVTTSIFVNNNEHDSIYERIISGSRKQQPFSDRIKSILGIPVTGIKVYTLNSGVERFPHLLANIICSSHSAMIDPMTRLLAGFASPESLMPSAIIRSSNPEHIDINTAYESMDKLDGQKAESILRRLSKSDPDNVQIWSLLGQVKLAEKDFKKAKEYLLKVTELRDSDPQIYFLLGMAYYCDGKFSEAYEAFKRSNDIKPLKREDLSFMGCAARNSYNRNDALAIFESIGSSEPDSAVCNLSRRCIACANGDYTLPEEQIPVKAKYITHGIYYAFAISAFLLGFVRSEEFNKSWLAIIIFFAPYLKFLGSYFKDIEKSPAIKGPYACWLKTGMTRSTLNDTELDKLKKIPG